jgi:hypothetical protein
LRLGRFRHEPRESKGTISSNNSSSDGEEPSLTYTGCTHSSEEKCGHAGATSGLGKGLQRKNRSRSQSFRRLTDSHSLLFPSTYCWALRLTSQYASGSNTTQAPRLRQAGEEGKLWWRAMTELDLAADPELLWRVDVGPDEWLFRNFTTISDSPRLSPCWPYIRKLAKGEDPGQMRDEDKLEGNDFQFTSEVSPLLADKSQRTPMPESAHGACPA